MSRSLRLILSCEHGGNVVPEALAERFAAHRSALESHRGFDLGALDLAQSLAVSLDAELHAHTVSRLVIDTNRSLGHPRLFSQLTRTLGRREKEHLIRTLYQPHRERVEKAIVAALRLSDVLHIGVHTFTPVLGTVRRGDIGLLYDPSRPRERMFAAEWREQLRARLPALRIRRNYPYRGAADGLTTHLRRRLREGYLGLELEVNQRHQADRPAWNRLKLAIAESILACARLPDR